MPEFENKIIGGQREAIWEFPKLGENQATGPGSNGIEVG